MLHRRQALVTLAAAASAAPLSLWSDESTDDVTATSMGLVSYCCGFQRRARLQQDPNVDLFAPQSFLEHCHSLGAGGMQLSLGVLDRRECQSLRRRAEELAMYVEAIVSMPENEAGVERFDAHIRTAADCGAKAARTTIIPGRRYEFFDSLDKYRDFAERGRQSLLRAVPVVEKYHVPLAVENHKDQRIGERIALLQQIGSEYVGACVDTGNSIALLDEPLEVVRRLAPWAHSVHLKDQAVQAYQDGFLLGDVALGRGCLPLGQFVQLLQSQKPEIRFSLELITRDPLKVPVLTPEYWATFPDMPAAELARTLRFVRDRAAKQLPYVSQLNPEGQLALEQANVRQSLAFARDQLKLVPTTS
jgi:sugar phosphate isomerase/epimerase